ncbi:MAG: VOC family protein, partial [Chloroflexota bacterium]
MNSAGRISQETGGTTAREARPVRQAGEEYLNKNGKSAIRFGGVNHLAMVTNDMDKTVRFYRDILGLRLVATTGNSR